MIRCLEKRYTQLDDQRKNHLDPKIPQKRNSLKQVEIHKGQTDHVENTNCTN